MHLDPRPFPTPYLRRHRFHEAVANSHHKVFAIPPGTPSEEIPDLAKMLLDEQIHDQECISQFDKSAFEIGFPTGAVNGTTVLGIFDQAAQDWLDELELEEMPTIWAPDGRYYLFEYVKPDRFALANCPVPGARLFNDSDWIPYPGSSVNGRLVHWEFDPWAFDTIELPDQFWARGRGSC